MKSNRYISFSILLLFTAALVCRLSASFMCSCDEHHHSQMHHCCDCPDHASECAYHDVALSQSGCMFHFSTTDTIFCEDLICSSDSKVLSRSNHTSSIDDSLIIAHQGFVDMGHIASYLLCHPHYLSSLLDGCGVSNSLRAPPVLI